MRWELKHKKELLRTVPFTVEALELIDRITGKPLSHPYHRLSSPDWVNILALTEDKKAILIRQSRAGSLRETLEIPGGMVDANEELELAAKRELEEETGYRCAKLTRIGQINPNPAIMANTLHMFLAKNCVIPKKREHFPDENEHLEIVLVPFSDLVPMVYRQEIDSALAALTIMMAQNQVD
ncbi:MAG: NUDIX hydrolase [Oligoflexus sp.]